MITEKDESECRSPCLRSGSFADPNILRLTEFGLQPAASHGTSVPVVRRLWLEPLYLLHFHFFAPV